MTRQQGKDAAPILLKIESLETKIKALETSKISEAAISLVGGGLIKLNEYDFALSGVKQAAIDELKVKLAKAEAELAKI